MKFLMGLMVISGAVCGVAMAQEVGQDTVPDIAPAAGPESGWDDLARQVREDRLKLGNLEYRVEKIEACNRQTKIYTPGAAFSDQSGCVEVTGKQDSVGGLREMQNTLRQANTLMVEMMTCEKARMVYSADVGRCVEPDSEHCPNGTLAVGKACVDVAVTPFASVAETYGQVTPHFVGALMACMAKGKRVATKMELMALCATGHGPAENQTVYLEPLSSAVGCKISINVISPGEGNGVTLCGR